MKNLIYISVLKQISLAFMKTVKLGYLFLKGMAVLCDIGKGSKALDILGSVEHILRSVKLLTVHASSSVVEFLVFTHCMVVTAH